MGATLPPMQTPPPRLFGTPGISSPKNHSTELVADLRDEPVPTTSPTKATGSPLDLIASICFIGPVIPCSSGSRPSRVILYMALACRGMSGRDQASGAGDRSSVLVSPGTLNSTIWMDSATASRLVNHSPSAQLVITASAWLLPCLANSATSWKASNISSVCLSCSAAADASSGSVSRVTRVSML